MGKVNIELSYDSLTSEQQKIADDLGFSQAFSNRNSIKECYEYIESLDPRATVGLALLQNTLALMIATKYILVERKLSK